MDQRTIDCLATLKPLVSDLAIKFLSLAQSHVPEGWSIKIISGSRTYVQQDALYEQGRSIDGSIVTNARGGQSLHNFGIAFDIGIFDQDGKYIDDYMGSKADAYYVGIEKYGEQVGLQWGGNWKGSLQDDPHFQYNPLNLSLSDMRSRVESGQSLF